LLPVGPKPRTRSSYADARFVNRIRSLVMVGGASRRTMSITIGSAFAGVAVSDAERPSPFCRYYLCRTRITACWRVARHFCVALWSTVRGRRRRRSLRMLTAHLIARLCADGGKVCTTQCRRCRFSAGRLREQRSGWNLLSRIRMKWRFYLGCLRCSRSSAPCAAKKSCSPPSLPGNTRVIDLRCAPEVKKRCGRGRRNTEAATAAAGVSAAAQLEGITFGSIRGCWTLPTA
jgi:hypothetical protein